MRQRILAVLILILCVAASPSGRKGQVRFPNPPDAEFEKQCGFYLILTGRGGRQIEDVVRAPGPRDVLNWLVGVTPDGDAYYVMGAQPQLDAHSNMKKVLGEFKDPEDSREVVVIGAGEAMGDHSIINDFSGSYRDQNNQMLDAISLVAESPVSKGMLPGTVKVQTWHEGHLDPTMKSRGEEGYYGSLFHDARNGIQAAIGPFMYREQFRQMGASEEETQEFFRSLLPALREPGSIKPLLDLIEMQKKEFSGKLPPGLLLTKLMLQKALNHKPVEGSEVTEQICGLTERELEQLHDNLKAMLAALSNQPVEIIKLGKVELGLDGKYHMAKKRSPDDGQVTLEFALPPVAGTLGQERPPIRITLPPPPHP